MTLITHNPYSPVFQPPDPPRYDSLVFQPPDPPRYEQAFSQMGPSVVYIRVRLVALPILHLPGALRFSYPQPQFPRTQCSLDSWKKELERLSSSQQVSRKDLHLFVQGTANLLQSWSRGNYEVFFEKSKVLYEKFLEQDPSREEIRSFWISYIRLIEALTWDNGKLFGIYQKIVDDGCDLRCPIPWDVTANVIECIFDDSRRCGDRVLTKKDRLRWRNKVLSLFQRNMFAWSPDPRRDTHLAQFIKRDLEISLSDQNIPNSHKEWVSLQLEKIRQFLDSCPQRG